MFVKLVTMKIKSLTYFCLCVEKQQRQRKTDRESTRDRERCYEEMEAE